MGYYQIWLKLYLEKNQDRHTPIHNKMINNLTISNEYQLSISEISTYCKLDHSWYKVEQHLTSHPQSIDCLTGMFSTVSINFFIFNMTRNLTGPKASFLISIHSSTTFNDDVGITCIYIHLIKTFPSPPKVLSLLVMRAK